jgi:hypothetical protein
VIKIINDNGMIWCVKVNGSDPRPVVEFYDCRYEHTPYGQFVSRYYVETLLENILPGVPVGGLNLDGGVPSWSISAKAMGRVIAWLQGLAVPVVSAEPLAALERIAIQLSYEHAPDKEIIQVMLADARTAIDKLKGETS